MKIIPRDKTDPIWVHKTCQAEKLSYKVETDSSHDMASLSKKSDFETYFGSSYCMK